MADRHAEKIGLAAFILCVAATASTTTAFEYEDEYHQCSTVSATAASRRFSYALYKTAAGIMGPKKNLLLSPLAVGMSLSMLAPVAMATSSKQLYSTLEQKAGLSEYELDQECLLSAYHGNRYNVQFLFKDHDETNGMARLRTATRLYGDKNLTFTEDFVQNTGQYGAEMAVVPFHSNPKDAERRINSWVKDQTDGNIMQMIRPRTIKRDTKIAITCAVYFKGTWLTPFTNASKGDFYIYNGKRRDAEYMISRSPVRYFFSSELNAEIAEVPYASPDGSNIDASLILVMPHKSTLIREVERRLSDELILEILAQNVSYDTRVQLPKFEFFGEQRLKLFLKRMGVREIFSERNARLFDAVEQDKQRRKVHVSYIYHKTRFQINETGTQGDAFVAYDDDSFSNTEENIVTYNKPFIFLLYDKFTDNIIYAGRFADPSRNL